MIKFFCIRALIILSVLLSSCHLATKDDLANLREDIREDLRQEVKGQSEDQAAQVEKLEAVIEDRIPEQHSLAGMVAALPVWGWYGLEFIVVMGFFLTNMVIASWRNVRMAMITSDEGKALTLVEMIVRKIRKRHPDPPDDKPHLRVIK